MTLGALTSLAKEYQSTHESLYNTNTVSTLEYMSPETLKHSVYFKQSDVYSFGVLAFELLAEADFTSMSGYQHIDAITNKKYRPDLAMLPGTDQLRALIAAAWDDDWKVRPSMSQICKVLLQVKAALPSDPST